MKIIKEAEGIIFAPRASEIGNPTGCMYPRVIELKHSKGELLATFENYSKKEPVFAPIYKSADGGYSWKLFSKIEDTSNGYGMRYQPTLYELDKKCGDLDVGTLLFAGNSIPKDMSSTEIVFYISRDRKNLGISFVCCKRWCAYRAEF